MDWLLPLAFGYLLICTVPAFVGACILAMERGTPIRVTRAGISWFCRESAAHALIFGLLPIGWWPTSPRFHDQGGTDLADGATGPAKRRPVLLVHGYGLNRSCFRFLKTYLYTRGWTWVWGVNNRPLNSPIPDYAKRIQRAVERLKAESGYERIDIVAHSMGGLVAAWYMAKLDGAQNIHRLVTLGTPWAGTRTHVFGLRREARDLAPGAEVVSNIRSLTGDIVAVWSDSDHLVIPTHSAAPEQHHCIEIDHLGHVEMLMSARVFRVVADVLGAPPHDGGEE